MLIRELSNKEFNSFKTKINYNNIYQTIEYGMIMEKQNTSYKVIGLIDQDNIIAGGIIFINDKKRTAFVPRGFILDYKDFKLLEQFTILLKKYLFENNIKSIKIDPLIIKNTYDFKYSISNPDPYFEKIYNNLTSLGYKHLGFTNLFENDKPRYEAIINLEKPLYTLFKDIKKEYRTKIRSSEKNGVEIFRSDSSELDQLYLQTKHKYSRDLDYFKDCYKYFSINNEIEFYYAKLNCDTYLKRCTKLYHEQEELVQELNEKFMVNKNLIHKKMAEDIKFDQYKENLLIATKYLKKYPEGIILSSALVVKSEKDVYLLIDGFNEHYKNLNAKHLLYWKLIAKYSESKFEKFNLGGIANPNIKSKYSGLNSFKLNFNATAYEYIGEFELLANPKIKEIIKKNSLVNKLIKKKTQ